MENKEDRNEAKAVCGIALFGLITVVLGFLKMSRVAKFSWYIVFAPIVCVWLWIAGGLLLSLIRPVKKESKNK